jgi:hypothetical protein
MVTIVAGGSTSPAVSQVLAACRLVTEDSASVYSVYGISAKHCHVQNCLVLFSGRSLGLDFERIRVAPTQTIPAARTGAMSCLPMILSPAIRDLRAAHSDNQTVQSQRAVRREDEFVGIAYALGSLVFGVGRLAELATQESR